MAASRVSDTDHLSSGDQDADLRFPGNHEGNRGTPRPPQQSDNHRLGDDAGDPHLAAATQTLWQTRPTAVNLHWALTRMNRCLAPLLPAERCAAAW